MPIAFLLAGLVVAFAGNILLSFCYRDAGLRNAGAFLNTSGLAMIGTCLLMDWVVG